MNLTIKKEVLKQMNITVGTKQKIIEMLGKNIAPANVGMAVGVTESYISQLLADEDIAAEVSRLRTESLEAHSARDAKADSIEDKLLDKLKDSVDYMVKPGEILRAYQVVNQAKRRGVDSASSTPLANNTVINLILPKHTMARFTTNSMGQVVEAQKHNDDGSTETQSLVTIQSNKVKALLGRAE